MQQYFIRDSVPKKITVYERETVHHITRVMRMEEGDIVALCGSDSKCFAAQILDHGANYVMFERLYALKAVTHPLSITLALSMIRKSPFELALQKAVELGIEGFIPLATARSVVKVKPGEAAKKKARYEKIAMEASEQSRRNTVPTIQDVTTLTALDLSEYDAVYVPYENEDVVPAKEAFKTLKRGMKVLIVIGPEGGFSDEEIEHLLSLGATSLSLGPRILRSETAVFYTLSAINYEMETEVTR
ncbi:MAG: RsmE family RNA methyltransferase [Bacillota bacterium]